MQSCKTAKGTLLDVFSQPEKEMREMSRAKQFFCPFCGGQVEYNNGKIKTAYFSHKKENSECAHSREKETKEHKYGKELLIKFAKANFPHAFIQEEYYIAKTGQIADVIAILNKNKENEQVLAFEYQRSFITYDIWEKRHQFYQEAGVIDFWFFDDEKFARFNNKREGRRRKGTLSQEIYNEYGYMHFLSLGERIRIDWCMKKKAYYNEYADDDDYHLFHSPIKNEFPLDKIYIEDGLLLVKGYEKEIKNRKEELRLEKEMEIENKRKRKLNMAFNKFLMKSEKNYSELNSVERVVYDFLYGYLSDYNRKYIITLLYEGLLVPEDLPIYFERMFKKGILAQNTLNEFKSLKTIENYVLIDYVNDKDFLSLKNLEQIGEDLKSIKQYIFSYIDENALIFFRHLVKNKEHYAFLSKKSPDFIKKFSRSYIENPAFQTLEDYEKTLLKNKRGDN